MFTKATRFETLLEAVRDALVGMDQKGEIRFVNRQTELLFGYDRDDLIGEHIDRLVPEALWQIYASHQENYFADPRTRSSGLDLELSGRHKNGVEFPVYVSLSHIDTGDVLLVITGADDVAKQKDAVKNAERITAIVEHSVDAIIGTTSEGVITSWNPAAERMYGYSGREIVGRSINLLIPEDRAGEFSAVLDRAKRGETLEPRVTVRVRKDGSLVPVSVTVAPLRDEEGRMIGTSAVHRDVTEQRRAFEVAQRMEAIVQSSDDAIIGRTLEGIVTTWNPAAERMYGYTSAEIIGQPIDRLVPEDGKAETRTVLAKIKQGLPVERLETMRVRKDGTLFPVSVTVSPIRDPDGKIIGASGIHRDVTEQRRAFTVAQDMKAIVENSHDAIIGRTLEGTIMCWNPAAERLYGYTSEEIIGTPFDRLVPQDRLPEISEAVAKIMAGLHVDRLETIRVRKDGTPVPVSSTLSPIRGEGGAIVGISAIHRDVTEQRQAFAVAQRMEAIIESSDDARRDLSEQELAAQYVRSLLEVHLDPLITLSREGKITDVNEATVKITGVRRDRLLGSHYAQYVTEPGKAIDFIQEVISRGVLTDVPLTVRHQNGTLTHVLCNASVFRDFKGDVLGVLATGRDVTKTQ